MKTFKRYIAEHDNNTTTEVITIYGGRFQPMHPGHYEVVRSLEKKFGGSSVVIATSNKVDADPNAKDYSPFNFDEKRKIISGLFRPTCDIVMCKNPTFSPSEITSNAGKRAVILVVSEKDRERYEGKNKFYRFLPDDYKHGDPLLNFKSTGIQYVYVSPMKENGLSATEVRKNISHDNENTAFSYFKNLYGTDNKEIFNLIRSKLI
jgi:glycerol-3-phosphate cytidylyltransferase-like family protein